ncbi:hypothetical protein H1P_3550006 [Hyella patelloides LEGE 07179]|uniref:Uncharacterized protein n=1 Tax=Hyella patelloides LEGE 07179 TaxID=945734 RepID=A0A563VWL2_9CYAN|nr:hypothetical protein [Hyella patelloides]VEP15643.1 hypothetical protein H1P_3550006 [Hyella patelloides LEGE 07179]
MKTLSNSRAKISQSELASSEYLTKEIEKMNRAIKDCQAKDTSTYVTLDGKPYLVTPYGAMSYEGTTTVAYSQSKQYREE